MTVPANPETHRSRVAAEVLELGETLFDAVLDAALAHSGSEPSEPLPEAELRTAAEEFFRTLRVLLECNEGVHPETERAPATGSTPQQGPDGPRSPDGNELDKSGERGPSGPC
jgi:hypothetical protein